ncbi:hypothetical protein BDN72DRAFT_369249 [Pluteus cervinus]|uniref:Uncharacterized protein n=1 Tax=Pluteus cervinus TaxID=181527 RepID=A0ACD3BEY2_9AGAR|nr:hypothetical protein BDN72DRAFT_369249 [Pluteus cervinus]
MLSAMLENAITAFLVVVTLVYAEFSVTVFLNTATSVLAFGTWAWLAVLIKTNNKPWSDHHMTRASSHFISCAILTDAWLSLASLLLLSFTNPSLCKPLSSNTQWVCEVSITSVVGAWIVFLSVTMLRVVRNLNHHDRNVAANDEHKKTSFLLLR